MSYSVIFRREGAEEFEKALTLSLAAINAIDTRIYEIQSVNGIKFTGDVWRFYDNDAVKVSILEDHQFARFNIQVDVIQVDVCRDDETIWTHEICIYIPWDQIYSIISA